MTYKLFEYQIDDGLRNEIQSVPLTPIPKGSGHAGVDYKRGWIGDLHNTHFSIDKLESGLPYIFKAIGTLHSWLEGWTVDNVMLNRLGPRSSLDKHRDSDTGAYRFHLPVITNREVYWWDEIVRQSTHFMAGYWHGPVPYANVLHSMRNNSNSARYHIVVDMKPPQ